MENPVSSRTVVISRGKVEIPFDSPLELGKYDVKLEVIADVTKKELRDLQDGSYEEVLVLKATEVKVLD